MLSRKIVIQRLTLTPDSVGGFSESWVTLSSPFARCKPMTGREVLRADRLNSPQMYEFIIRWRSGLLMTDRIQFRGELYNIRSIVNIDEADMWLQIMGEKGVAQ